MSLPSGVPLKQTPLWEDGTQSDEDPLLKDAVDIIKKERKASISMLQRKMRIGYTRAARLIDRLEELGMIGPAQATSQVREVFILEDEESSQE
jgi:S-DNA-T family DNA segregation ATPase FtsK/SpoIIIE